MEMELEKFKEKNSKKTGIIVFTIASILLLAGVFFFTSFASYVDIKSFNIISGNIPNIGDALYVYHFEDGRITTITPDFTGMSLDATNTTCTYNATVSLVNNAIVLDKTNATNTSNQKIRCDIYLRGGFPVRAIDYMLELVSNSDLKQFGYDNLTNSYYADELSIGTDNENALWVDYNNNAPELEGNYYTRCAQGLNLNEAYNIAMYNSFEDCTNAKQINWGQHLPLSGRCTENMTDGYGYFVEMNGCNGLYETLSECQADLISGMTCENKPYYYGGYFIVGMDNNSIIINRDFDNDFDGPNEMNLDQVDPNRNGYTLKYNTFITSGSGTATDPFHIELRPDAPDGTYYSNGVFPEVYGYSSIEELQLYALEDNPVFSYFDTNYYGILIKTTYQNNAATSYEICIDNETTVECFKPELTSSEISKMQSFFGSDNCNIIQDGNTGQPETILCGVQNGQNTPTSCELSENHLTCSNNYGTATIDNTDETTVIYDIYSN